VTQQSSIPLFKLPSYSARRPANIPLHTLSSSARQPDADFAYLLDDHEHSGRSSFDTPSADSDFSLWSDTGDLVDQLADQEDPLRIRLQDSVEARPSSHRRPQKRVHYQFDEEPQEKAGPRGGIKKEDIEIPDPGPRTISQAERLLAAIMAPNDGPSRIHGLHGKKLM
jgi:hypothetical protein